MLEITLSGEGFSSYATFDGIDIWEAMTVAAHDIADFNNIKYNFVRPIAGHGFIHAHCTKASIKQDGREIFYFENGIDCYGQVREDATYDVKCEDEEDDTMLLGTDWTSWADAIKWAGTANGKVCEIESDC